MRKLALLTAATCLALAWAVSAQTPEDVRAIVDRAIKAHGGEKNLNKLNLSQSKAKGTIEAAGQTISFTIDGSLHLPDKLKVVVEVEVNNMKLLVTKVINGDKGWESVLGKTKELDKKTLEQSKQELHASEVGNLVGLKDKRYKLSALGEAKVGDKEAVGVQVSAKGYRDVNLYFQKGTGLLLKMEHRTFDPTTEQEVTQEKIFSDYKDVDGVKAAGKIVVKNDGKRYMELEVTETSFPSSLDPGIFTKP